MAEYGRRKVKKVKAKKPKKHKTAISAPKTQTLRVKKLETSTPQKITHSQKKRLEAAQREKERYLKKKPPEKKVSYTTKTATELNRPSRNLRVIKGRRKSPVKKFSSLLTIVVLVAVLLIVQFVTPTGIIESINNGFASLGSGEVPADISGNNVIDLKASGGNAVVLSNTYIEIFNKNGKRVLSEPHGINNPRMSVSESRIALYSPDSSAVKVYNYSKMLYELNVEGVYLAHIGRNGTFALVKSEKGYASVVEGYNKSGKQIFKWYSESELVNAVSVSKTGKNIATATVNVNSGSASSNVNIFKVGSNSPKYSLQFSDMVLSLQSVNGGFYAIGETELSYVKWRNGSKTAPEFKDNVLLAKNNFAGKTVVCSGINKDSQVSEMFVSNSSGKKTVNIEDAGIVKKLAVSNKYIFTLNENTIKVYSFGGKYKGDIAADYGIKMIAAAGDNIFTVVNSKIKCYTF